MLRRYYRSISLVLLALATSTLIGIFGIINTTKAADYTNPNDKMTEIAKQWLNSQALYRCWSLTDIDNRSKSDVEGFKFFDASLASSTDWDKVSVGYQSGNFSNISCSNGGHVKNFYQTINQEWASDGKKAFCAVPTTRSNGGESYNQCITGSANFDVSGGDIGAQADSFKTAIETLPKPKELSSYSHIGLNSDPLAYYVYRRTLEKHCGGGTNLLDGKVNLPAADSPTVVRASYVVGGTGEIQTFSYQLDKQQTEEVNVYAIRGNPSAKQLQCEQLSSATNNTAGAYAAWAIGYMNDQVADYLIAKASENAPGRECTGPAQLPEEDRCIDPMAQIRSAIRACAAGDAPGILGVMPFTGENGRQRAITLCAQAKIPQNLRDAFDGISDGQIAQNQDADGSAFEDEDGTSCSVDGIGWIICPVVTFLSEITDRTYDILADGLLAIQPSMFSQGGQTYEAWSAMRNIANVAFIVAFLFIIYSQITSAGISNYGMKKMLPRLVIAAILVNVSFWICAVAVDLSNILGYALKDLIGGQGSGSFEFHIRDGNSLDETGNGWTDLALVILAAGTVVYLGLSVLLPGLIIVLVALVTVVAVLAVRQALIILLIVIAPLAFVAWLLPNTEDWFKKWLGLLKTLLLMFPIISLIFGASALASSIVMASTQNIVVQIVGALILVVPLFITPIVMKTAGGFLNRFGGIVNNADKGVFDRMKKGSKDYRDSREDKRALRAMNGGKFNVIGGGRFKRRARRDTINQGVKNELARSTSQNIAQSLSENDNFRNRVAGGSMGPLTPNATSDALQRALSNAELTLDKAFAEAVTAEKATISSLDGSELSSIMKDSTMGEARRAAAAGQLMKVGSDKEIHQALSYLGTQAQNSDGSYVDKDIKSIQKQLVSDMGNRKPTSLGAGDISALSRGSYTGDFNDKVRNRLISGKLSGESLAQTSADELDAINAYISSNHASLTSDPQSAQALAALKQDIVKFRTSPEMQGRQPAYEVSSRLDSISGVL